MSTLTLIIVIIDIVFNLNLLCTVICNRWLMLHWVFLKGARVYHSSNLSDRYSQKNYYFRELWCLIRVFFKFLEFVKNWIKIFTFWKIIKVLCLKFFGCITLNGWSWSTCGDNSLLKQRCLVRIKQLWA